MANILITEVNSNATGGDFFELYNYGATSINLSNWKVYNSANAISGTVTLTLASGTTLAAGKKLIVASAADAASFRTTWGLPTGVDVVAFSALSLGKQDAVVIFDSSSTFVTSANYKATSITTSASTGSVVIPSITRTDNLSLQSNQHAGTAVGTTTADKSSAVWDGVSTSTPKYTTAVAGTLGAYSQSTSANGTGSPGAFITYSATTLAEAAANDGSITATLTLTLTGDTFTAGNGNSLLTGGQATITNVPSGLTAVLTQVNTTTATLSLTGNATSHANANDVSNLTVTFANSAFGNTTFGSNAALNVVDSTKSTLVIDFADSATLSYSTSTLSEARAMDGSINGKMVLTLSGDTFTGSNGDNLLTSKATVTNVPAGLTAVLTRTSSSTAELSFTGTATSHANANDISNLTVSFGNTAFTGGSAAGVIGSSKSDLSLDFGDVGTVGSVQTFTPNAGTTLGSSDASTAIPLDANWMVVGDDEQSVLRVYPRAGGAAVLEWNFSGATMLNSGLELDVEASTRIGDTLYFTGSHSNTSSGVDASNREHIFAVSVSGTGAATQFTWLGQNVGLVAALSAWDHANTSTKGVDYFGFAASAAAGVAPEGVNGFSIEGMTASQDGTELLLGFRAPQSSTITRDKAVIVKLAVAGLIGGATPTIDGAIELDLGGRGIRSIEKVANGAGYLILAGPAGSSSAAVTNDFRLFRWDGTSSTPTELNVSLDPLRETTGGSFETIVDAQSSASGTLVQLLQDNGDTVWSGQSVASKSLASNLQQFQGNWVALGADVVDSTAPVLASSTPANTGTNVGRNADLILKFDEGVKVGSGNFLIKKISDGSVVETIPAGDARITVAFNTVTINPNATLDYATAYYLEAANTVITDHTGNAWAGLSGSAAYSFTIKPTPLVYSLLITEVNSNATLGGTGAADFFELYNYGNTAIDLTGWKWVDDAANPSDSSAKALSGSIGSGQRIVVTNGTDAAAFRTAWNIPASVTVIAIGGAGLGSADAVTVFDSFGTTAAAFNYKGSNITASDGTVIPTATPANGFVFTNSAHAGVALGGSNSKASAVWDGVSTSTPAYKPATAGALSAYAQTGDANSIGSPGVDDVAPVISSAYVIGSTLTLTYNEALDATNKASTSTFGIKIYGGTAIVPTSVSVSGNTITLALPTGTAAGQTITVSYTDPTAGNDANAIQDTSGNDASSLVDRAVTNNTAPDPVPDPVPTTNTSTDSSGKTITTVVTVPGTVATVTAPVAGSVVSSVGAGNTTVTSPGSMLTLSNTGTGIVTTTGFVGSTTLNNTGSGKVQVDISSMKPGQILTIDNTGTGTVDLSNLPDGVIVNLLGSGPVNLIDNDGATQADETNAPVLAGGKPGDGNGDGLPDALQSNVTSLPFKSTPKVSQTANATPTYISLVADSKDGKIDTTNTVTATLNNVHQEDAPANLPPEVKMPLGLIAFTSNVSTPGVSETFSVYVDSTLGINAYWKQNAAGTWVNLASATYGGKVVAEGGKTRLDFQITDGGQFDADGKADGTITDPGALGFSAPLGQIFLSANNSMNLFNNLNAYGASGQETVRVQSGATITVDQNVERIELPGNLANFSFSQAGNTVQIRNAGSLVATVAVQGDADGTALTFNEGTVQLKAIAGIFNLGNQPLSSNANSFAVNTLGASLNSGVKTGAGSFSSNSQPTLTFQGVDSQLTVAESALVFGNSGSETLRIVNAPNITVDQNIERLEFDGTLASYAFLQLGNQVQIRKASNLVATVAVQIDSDGTTFAFTDGSAQVHRTGNTFSLGNQAVSQSSSASILPVQVGSSFNATDISQVPALASGALSLEATPAADATLALVGVSTSSSTLLERN